MTADLVAAGFLEDDVEGGLLLDGRSGGASGGRSGRGNRHRRGGADAPFFFELFYQVSDF